MKFVYHKGIPYTKIKDKIEPKCFTMQGRVFKPGMVFDVIGEGRTSFSIGVPLQYIGIKNGYAIFKPIPKQLSLFGDINIKDWYIALYIIQDDSKGHVHCLLCSVSPGSGYDVRWKSHENN